MKRSQPFFFCLFLLPLTVSAQIRSIASWEFDYPVNNVLIDPQNPTKRPVVIIEKKEGAEKGTPPKDEEIIIMAMGYDDSDVAEPAPVPKDTFFVMFPNQTRFALPVDEYPLSIGDGYLTTSVEESGVIKRYVLTNQGITLEKQLTAPSDRSCQKIRYGRVKDGVGEHFLPYLECKGDDNVNKVTFYSETLDSIFTFESTQIPIQKIAFQNTDTVSVYVGEKVATEFKLIVISLTNGVLHELSVTLPEKCSIGFSMDAGINKDGIFLLAQKYSKRETIVQKIDYEGSLKWKLNWPGYLTLGGYVPTSKEWIAFNSQADNMQTINHYNDVKGTLDKMEPYEDFFKHFRKTKAQGAWLRYMAFQAEVLPGGKHMICKLNAYSPSQYELHRSLVGYYNGTSWKDILITDDRNAVIQLFTLDARHFGVINHNVYTVYQIE